MAVEQSDMLIPLAAAAAAAAPLTAGYFIPGIAADRVTNDVLRDRYEQRMKELPGRDSPTYASGLRALDVMPGKDGRTIYEVARGNGGSGVLSGAIPISSALKETGLNVLSGALPFAGALTGAAIGGESPEGALAGAGLGTLGGSVGSYYLAKHLANKRLEAAGYKTASANTFWATEYLSMKRS